MCNGSYRVWLTQITHYTDQTNYTWNIKTELAVGGVLTVTHFTENIVTTVLYAMIALLVEAPALQWLYYPRGSWSQSRTGLVLLKCSHKYIYTYIYIFF